MSTTSSMRCGTASAVCLIDRSGRRLPLVIICLNGAARQKRGPAGAGETLPPSELIVLATSTFSKLGKVIKSVRKRVRGFRHLDHFGADHASFKPVSTNM